MTHGHLALPLCKGGCVDIPGLVQDMLAVDLCNARTVGLSAAQQKDLFKARWAAYVLGAVGFALIHAQSLGKTSEAASQMLPNLATLVLQVSLSGSHCQVI